jgi:hypothetical protein
MNRGPYVGEITIAPQSRTPAGFLATESGEVEAGSRSAEFIFSSDFTGTLLGLSYAGETDSTQRVVAPAGDTLGQIPYTITAGYIRIITVT